MNNNYKRLMEDSPIGYACHRKRCDVKGTSCDYEFIEGNMTFKLISGGERPESDFNWFELYRDLDDYENNKEFDFFSKPLNKWYKISVHSPEENYYITHFMDISKEKEEWAAELTVVNSELAFQNEEKEERVAELLIVNADLKDEITKRKKAQVEIKKLNNELEDKISIRTNELEETKAMLEEEIKGYIKSELVLKEGESRLISAQAMVHVGNWELDLETNNTWASEEVFNIYGIEPVLQYLPLNLVQKSIFPEYQKSIDSALIGLITKKEKYDVEFKIKNIKTGEEHYVQSKAILQFDESGHAIKVVGTTQDITKTKKKEEEIRHLSYHDELTGLYNRRFYEKELKRLDKVRNLPLTIVMGDVNGLKLINDSFGHNSGDELLRKVAVILKKGCREKDVITRLGGDEFMIILPSTSALEAEHIISRLNEIALKEKVSSVEISISFGYETKINRNVNIQEIVKSAENNMYQKKLFEGPSMREKTITTIMRTLYERSNEEEMHSHRVSDLCTRIGKEVGLKEAELEELKSIGLLHDIGKIAIEESILSKTGELTEDEWNEIKRHPELGYRILNTVNDMTGMALYVLYHHERWDGKGYPKGLKGDEIPLISRIIHIAGAYDAMTHESGFKSALPEKLAIEELQKNKGSQFAPELVNVFIEKILGEIAH